MLLCIVTFNLWLHYNKLLTYLLKWTQWQVEIIMSPVSPDWQMWKYLTDIKTRQTAFQRNQNSIFGAKIQTSVCHKLHVVIVKVGGRPTVCIGKCQRAYGLVWSIAARSLAEIHCSTSQRRTHRCRTANISFHYKLSKVTKCQCSCMKFHNCSVDKKNKKSS